MIETSFIVDKHDKDFIEDAIHLYEKGFFRASYLMAWLCCVESFRSKFEILAKKEGVNKIWNKIKSLENEHKSADMDIIQGALESNFINEIEKQKLEYFYKMRCIYGHPYEQSPNAIDCEHIIQSVIDISLSKKLLLGKTSIDSILKKITEEESFLENDEEKQKEYFLELLERIEQKEYIYLLQKLAEYYEYSEKENEDNFSFYRTKYFAETVIEKIGLQNILGTLEQQEDFIYKTKKIALDILPKIEIYAHLDEHIKSIIFNELKKLKDSKKLSLLINSKLLSETQIDEIQNLLESNELNLDYFDANYIINILIKKLESLNFDKQNSAIYTIQSPHIRGTLKICEEDDLILLGRNILQSANHKSGNEYYSKSAYEFLCNANKLQSEYPSKMVMGIVAECFTNEKINIIRPKTCQISEVEKIFKLYSDKTQNKILQYVESLIKSYDYKQDYEWNGINSNSPFYPLIEKIKDKEKILAL